MSKDTLDHLDNDKEELRESILNLTGMCGGPYDYAHRCSALHCDHCGVCDYSEEILAIVEAHTQSKLKAFAGEVEEAIGKNDRDYSQDNTDHDSKIALVASSTACNELRSELRQALKAIKEKYKL